LRIAAADGTLVVTVAAGSAAGVFSDITHTDPNAEGDRIAIKGANAASANSATCAWMVSHRPEA